jgi:ABC-type branched-subunit amino acid transport system ATPase component
MGLVKASKGTIIFDGEDITNYDTHMIVNKGIALCPEEENIPKCYSL